MAKARSKADHPSCTRQVRSKSVRPRTTRSLRPTATQATSPSSRWRRPKCGHGAPQFCRFHYNHSDTSVSMTWITVRWGPIAPSSAFCVLRSFVASRRRGPRQRVTREGEYERKGRDPHHTADQLLAARRPQRLLRPVTTRWSRIWRSGAACSRATKSPRSGATVRATYALARCTTASSKRMKAQLASRWLFQPGHCVGEDGEVVAAKANLWAVLSVRPADELGDLLRRNVEENPLMTTRRTT